MPAARLSPLPANVPGAELRHGYTLSQVAALSVFAVRRQLWHQAADFDERLEIAWHAIIEHIYASDQPPPVRDVIRAGWKAISDQVGKTHRFYGLDTHDRYAGTTAGFERYWWYVARAVCGPEENVTERVALAQIWPRLRPVYREALAALAAFGDYGLAAESLGKSRKTFTACISQARREFLALWHEGEAPSRPWGQDRRIKDTDRHSITYRTIRLRQRQARKTPPRDRAPRPRQASGNRADLGISGAELVRRYEGGETVRQIAASLGRSYGVVHRRLHAEGAELRPAGRVAGRR
ncbi:MAG TPA: helix-turn-helix domain-containing protein [Streptosporangiaceae bacterium]|jgi:hypothetical protein